MPLTPSDTLDDPDDLHRSPFALPHRVRGTARPVARAAREVLDPAHVRTALRVTPADATVAAALRCGTAVALALVTTAAAGHRDLAGFAALGALASLYGRHDPYRRRAALLVVMGAALLAVIVLTTLTGAGRVPAAAAVVVVALVAGAAHALCLLLRTGPPGATIVVFAAGAGLAGAPTVADLGPRTAAAALGAALAWAVCCAGYLVRPTAPARLAVLRAARAVDAAASGRDEGPPRASAGARDAAARARAVGLLDRARTVLADDASHARTRPEALRLAAEVERLELRLTSLDPQGSGTGSSAGSGGGSGTGVEAAALPARLPLRWAAALARREPGWRLPTVRVAVAALLAASAAEGAGFGHPAWAAMGATATLQGQTAGHVLVRALQRAGGTVLGAVIAWPLLEAHLGFWSTAVLVVVLQVVTEVVVGRHYGVAMLTITPMALLMTSLGASGDVTGLAVDRAVDTVLGAVVALVVGVVLTDHHRGARVPIPA